jgi:hypothetical protein
MKNTKSAEEKVRKNIENANRHDNARLAKAQREEVARRAGNAPRVAYQGRSTSDLERNKLMDQVLREGHAPRSFDDELTSYGKAPTKGACIVCNSRKHSSWHHLSAIRREASSKFQFPSILQSAEDERRAQ